MKVEFRSPSTPPPGGKFFYEFPDGERVESRWWCEMEPLVEAGMRKRGMSGVAKDIVAEFMCPQIEDWYCRGVVPESSIVRMREAKENSKAYFPKSLVTFDEISRRLNICAKCKMHRRDFCLTCTGLDWWISNGFSGRRPRVPEDSFSGTCVCARALEAVIASVGYGDDEAVWDNVPSTCWRHSK